MNELEGFLSRINTICQGHEDLSIENARSVIQEINDFLYTSHDELGYIRALGADYKYFSRFHKYWEQHHKEILNIQIDDDKCEKVADVLHEVYQKTGGRVFKNLYDTNGLRPDEVCRVRFLTANQDFRGSRNFKELSDIFKDDPDIFTVEYIIQHPEGFLNRIETSRLSQNDKRISYAKRIGEFLQEKQSSPYNLINYYNNDVYALRKELIEYVGAGYGNKKADMFIRDMVILGVWKNVRGFDKIDVASDVNTIKVALRTGILKTEIPLLSSFLDIFCYQYSYVDEMNALAWRKVWEKWNDKYDEGLESPSLLDYFIYGMVGREFCKENLYTYQCPNGHLLVWHNARKKICHECAESVEIIKRQYICEADDGSVVTERILPEYTNCPFKRVCDETNQKKLQPPKSISIKGQTGWDSAYTYPESGGGGLMA